MFNHEKQFFSHKTKYKLKTKFENPLTVINTTQIAIFLINTYSAKI